MVRPSLQATRNAFSSSDENVDDRQKLVKYQHGFWAPELASLRKTYFQIISTPLTIITALIFLTFVLYFGSYNKVPEHVPKLKGWIVNRDDGALGQAMLSAFQANSMGAGVPTNAHLTWEIKDQSSYPLEADVIKSVVHEDVWTAVVVHANATTTLNTARTNGDITYNASNAITFFYNQGRNEFAANNYIVPYTTALLEATLKAFANHFTQQYVQQNNSADVLSAIEAAPQTFTRPFDYTTVNLRPFTKPNAQALFDVGPIFLGISVWLITYLNTRARSQIGPYLRLRSYLMSRIAIPTIAYFQIASVWPLISLIYGVTIADKWSKGKGMFIFMIWTWFGLMSLGLAMEVATTVVGAENSIYIAIVWIIINLAGDGRIPFDLKPSFFKYGFGLPFYNTNQAIRTIIFDTKNDLAMGVYTWLGWLFLNTTAIIALTWFMRWMEKRRVPREDANGQMEETSQASMTA